ncbi:fructose-6-phosphate aldolase [Ligilactobacillus murinus]|uniref:fructose-6-phosphate aldolase n=1 Tax=Ligilactobacillus murinus TaxID=1622 RepID=UPI00296AB186|nr:fructose-6-phosphate aldolase [Ligilactobacillus murinus]WOY89030.1 fructose-6-phosphate aldolase [Ligilactobacillus murinus]
MEFFLDTANTADIEQYKDLIAGVTTNPSLIAREGRDFKTVVKEITNLVPGPISAEVTATTAPEMIAQAHELVKLAPNVVIKIPMTVEGLKAVKQLHAENINTNVTLIFSLSQGLLAANAGATYISPFIGRLDDIGADGTKLIQELRQGLDNAKASTKIIAASIRSVKHVEKVALAGADIATIPTAVFSKLFEHPLTEKGLAAFMQDWDNFKEKR